MGSLHSKLFDFFDPSILESVSSKGLSDDSEDETAWFEHATRVNCACQAVRALSSSVSNCNVKFQNILGVSSHSLLSNLSFWLARRGPVELIIPALGLIEKTVTRNSAVRLELSQAILKVNIF